jgi:hypothetical protein
MLSRALILGFCIGVIGASAALLERDTRAVFLVRGTTNDQIASLSNPNFTIAPPASARTLRDLLSSCARLTLLAPALKANPALAETVRQRCAEFAANTLRTAPGNARARALAALMAPNLTAAEFAIAQRIARYEPWPLATRLSAIAATDTFEPDLRRLAKADFFHALLSFWGRSEVAKLYLQHSQLRPLIHEALADLPPSEQANFIRLVRQTLPVSG